MGLFNFFKKSEKESKTTDECDKLLSCAKEGILEIEKEFKALTKEAKFEVILYNSNFVLNIYREKFPDRYNKVEAAFFKCIIEEAKTRKLPLNGGKLIDFINSRLRLYFNEYDKIINSNLYVPSIVFNAFYKSPLSNKISQSSDLIEIMQFNIALAIMTLKVHEITNKVLTASENLSIYDDLINLLIINIKKFDDIFAPYQGAPSTKSKDFEVRLIVLQTLVFKLLEYFPNKGKQLGDLLIDKYVEDCKVCGYSKLIDGDVYLFVKNRIIFIVDEFRNYYSEKTPLNKLYALIYICPLGSVGELAEYDNNYIENLFERLIFPNQFMEDKMDKLVSESRQFFKD